MATIAFINMSWAICFSVLGAVVGILLVLLCARLLPAIFDRLTPNIDEEKEMIRGNTAVAEYFGRIVAAGIIGTSIVVAAAVLGGLIAALHG